jgi:hypothetical protein
MKNLLLLLGVNCNLFAGSIVTEEYLDKVAMIESNFNYEAEGDGGKALGAWQMHEAAWRGACLYLYFRDMDSLYNHHADCFRSYAKEPWLSRHVARACLELLEKRMIKKKIKPTRNSLYMCYNMGFYGAMETNFSLQSPLLSPKRKGILERANYILSR